MKLKNMILIFVISFNCASCQIYDPGFDYRNFDNTPVEKLARAVQDDDIDEINRLIKEKKMDVNYQDKKFGNTLLSLALVNQNITTVEALLKLGANPNIFGGKNNSNPFIDAIEYTYPARTCDASKIRLLIKYGADVNAITNDTLNELTMTALMHACEEGCIDVVKALVENGADINKWTKNEANGPITLSLIQDNIEIAKYLIVDKKADIPKCVLIREANINYVGEPETRLTITDMLLEDDYNQQPSKQKAKEEILIYLKKIGKR